MTSILRGLFKKLATERDPVCGMAIGRAPAQHTSLYSGKIYYFCSKSCKEQFDGEPTRYVTQDVGSASHGEH